MSSLLPFFYFYFHTSPKSGYHSHFQSVLETFAKMNLKKDYLSHLNYVIGLLKYLLWLPILYLQNPLHCTFRLKGLLQLQCSTCACILLLPFLLLRSLIWLSKSYRALRLRSQLLVQVLNLSDLFNLLLSLPLWQL